MTTETRQSGSQDGFAVTLFWGSVLVGLMLPALSMWLAKRRSLAEVFNEYWHSFTGAEPGLAIMTALHAAPFVAFGVFCLLHLGRIPAQDASLASRRLTGALVAALLMIAVSLWGNTSIFASRSSTAPIGFLFVPFYVLFASALGYGVGRFIARLAWRR
jgi:hypothetical protein